MGYRILADENVERRVCRYLETAGHDAVMVVDELGSGADDPVVADFDEETGLVTFTEGTFVTASSRSRTPALPRPEVRTSRSRR